MTQVIQFGLLGLGAGAVYALLAEGVVLIFRGSGILNLAHGAIAMFAAFIFHALTAERGWSVAPAMVVTLLVAAGIGLATDQLVMRPLRGASSLARLIGTLAVLLILQAIAVLYWGQEPVTIVLPWLPSNQVGLLGTSVPADRLWTLGIAVALTAVLTLAWRYTRLGWVTEAVSENQRASAALGWSPQVVSGATWAVGAALAGFAGILVSPITQLNPTNLTLIVIAAMAAALIGGFRSFPLTLLGGLMLGSLQAIVGNYVHTVGAVDTLPFLIIVVVLILRGSALPLRGYVFDRYPDTGTGAIHLRWVAIFVALGTAVFIAVKGLDWLSALTTTFAVAIILLSLVVLVGYAGQVSLAQYALAGLGALITAQLYADAGWPFIPAMLVGMCGTAGVGFLFALPALRTRGVNLAVVTLGLGLATNSLFFNNYKYVGRSGLNVDGISIFGWSIAPLSHPNRYGVFTFVVFVISCILVANLRRSSAGRALLAVRDNERAAAACGINVFEAKLYAFTVSGLLAGLGGVLLAFRFPVATFTAFDPVTSISAIAMAVIGGIGYVIGPLAGAPMYPGSFGTIIATKWQNFLTYLPLVTGVLLLLTLLLNRGGVISANLRIIRRLRPPKQTKPPAPEEFSVVKRAVPKIEPKTLTVADLTVTYGGVVAVNHMNFEVRPGEVVGLIGPNGAGKTSLIDAVTGFTRYSGQVAINGTAIDRWSAHQRTRGGMTRSFQGLELFPEISVRENIQIAADRRAHQLLVTDLVYPVKPRLSDSAVAAVGEFQLAETLERLPDELTYGQRRLVGIARAVASQPSILLLDEPVSGLDDSASQEFAHLVRRLADSWGLTILVVEHDMEFVMGLCDRVIVMDFGNKLVEGTPAQVINDPAAIAAYLGDETEDSLEEDSMSQTSQIGTRP